MYVISSDLLQHTNIDNGIWHSNIFCDTELYTDGETPFLEFVIFVIFFTFLTIAPYVSSSWCQSILTFLFSSEVRLVKAQCLP